MLNIPELPVFTMLGDGKALMKRPPGWHLREEEGSRHT
jgi:hypothetical protein